MCMNHGLQKPYLWAFFYPEKAKIVQNSCFLVIFEKRCVLCNHETWFAGISKVYKGVTHKKNLF